MKLKIFTLLFAVMASIGALFAQTPLITIDGNFSDWGGNPLVIR